MKNKLKLINDLGMLKAKESSKVSRHYGLYECPICNKEFKALLQNVKRGITTKCKKCGASGTRFRGGGRPSTHGLSGSVIYNRWLNIKNRCTNKYHKSYAVYGGRGIAVEEPWSYSFDSFYDWFIKELGDRELSKSLHIHRVDNDGNYSPENCILITREEHLKLHNLSN